jgi:hypothetical protein
LITLFGDFGLPDELLALVFTPLPKFSLLSVGSSLEGGFIDLEEFSLIPDGFKFVTGVCFFPMFFENLENFKNNLILILWCDYGSGRSDS